jgi:hypothetical protein
MNDNELTTVVKESVADVHMTVPQEQIMSRGRVLRARRQIPVLGVALAGATAGAVLAATALLSASHQPNAGHQPDARLAAWTVRKQANGDIDVTINQLRNPVGLQSTLRADGLPVRVSYSGHPLQVTRLPGGGSGGNLRMPGPDGGVYQIVGGIGPAYHGPLRRDGQAPRLPCKGYPISNDVLNEVVNAPGGGTSPHGGTVYLVIKPSALPAGAGLAMFVGGSIDDIAIPNSAPPGTGGSVGESTLSTSKDGQPRVLYSVTVSPVYASQQCTG